jgi:CHAT domain-containing protein/tetratricopeptide (TPR) repeat protein
VTARLKELTAGQLAAFAVSLPQQARLWAEAPCAGAWADDIARGDRNAAQRELQRIRIIGDALAAHSSEFLLKDLADALDRTDGEKENAEGLRAWRDGRVAYASGALDVAERDFVLAADFLSRTSNPMAAAARFYLACALYDQSRTAEAQELLTELLASEKNAPRHPSLIARIEYELALCEALAGQWSEALDLAQDAASIYRRLGERGLEGTAAALLSEAYSFLGQPSFASKYAISALRTTCAAGDLYRARVVLAAMCRMELRQKQWQRTEALAQIEEQMARLVPGPLLAFDLHMRAAVAAFQLGEREDADSEMQKAAIAANALPDARVRERARADIAGVAGTMARRDDPRRAIALLDGAIAFEVKAERSILLPQLLLERGRAFAALPDVAHAHDDFEEGIRRLEQQRRRLNDADLRPGIFDDAEDLFSEAVSLELGRGDIAAAFAYVERGRARAMLEEIAGDEAAASPPSIAAVANRIPAGGVFVEYAVLPHEVAMFTIDGGRLAVRRVPVERTALQGDVRAFVAALKEHRPVAGIQPLAMRLHAILIGTVADHADDLMVVGDTLLQQVPFAALIDPRTHSCLVEHCSIATAPSAAVLLLSERGSESPVAPAAISVFTDPTRELIGADDEARMVSKQYPSATVVSGEDATAAKFTELAPLSEVVHFAGHAVTYAAEPWRSALVFAHDTLNAHDVARMHFRSTRLIVLAACTTFGRKKSGVEGVPSVARAFLVAGVPSVVGTLWDIDDREVGDVIRRFHSGVAHGLTPATALREAQVAEIHAGRHPAEWSAFEVLGRR